MANQRILNISIVLAIHNEAKNLPACLDAVKSLADEIIIVDGQSTDESVKIAKSYGAIVISTSNKANFHINKQLAMDKAKGLLVLQLDADEVVDEELADFIKQLAKKLGQLDQKALDNFQPKAWYLKRKNLFLKRWLKKGGQYPDPVIRLYINGFAHLPQKDVHEQMAVDGLVAWADGHLLHFSNHTFKAYLQKFNTYTSFKAEQLFSKKVKINLFNSLLYLVIKPMQTFLSLFIRHKGFVDAWAGFIFALFSGLHHLVAYLKLWELYAKQQEN